MLSKFRNWSQIPHSKDRILFMLKKCLNIIFLQIWRKYINKLVFPEWAIHRIVQKWRMLNPKWSRSTGFLDLFYGKSEVSVKTLLIFLFYCGQVSRETFVKMVDILLSFFWHQKWNWLMVSWISRGIKLWNRHIRSAKKNETDGTRLRRGRQFHFFADRMWRFHNFSHVKSWNHSHFHFWAKKR